MGIHKCMDASIRIVIIIGRGVVTSKLKWKVGAYSRQACLDNSGGCNVRFGRIIMGSLGCIGGG